MANAPELIPHAAGADWQSSLKNAIRNLDQLLAALDLTAAQCNTSELAARSFPVRVPLPFLERMQVGDPADPLLRQVLASGDETLATPGFVADPLAEAAANPLPGLIHKYRGRVLLMPTSACAVHCRYCFRRHFPYADNRLDNTALDRVIAWLGQQPEINEVILSGGDPLTLTDTAIDHLIGRLESVPGLTRLRIHSRLPVVIPARVTEALSARLAASRLKVVMVVHSNHPNEIDQPTLNGLRRFRDAGLTTLNQSVLLAGVNDSADTLAVLSERLFDAGTLPYYLHLPDAVAGTAHFDVAETRGVAIHRVLQQRLPGYLVPKLVREVPGEPGKRMIATT